MNILIALFIGIAVNLDNLLIGIQLGLQGRRLTIWQNLLIGSITGLFAFGSTMAARLISGNFLAYANLAGSLLMTGFGLYCLCQSFTTQEPSAIQSSSFQDTLLLSLVLAVNCIPPSFSAGALSLSPFWVGFFSLLFSCLSIQLSTLFGHRLSRCRFVSFLAPLSACLLIGLGVGELLF